MRRFDSRELRDGYHNNHSRERYSNESKVDKNEDPPHSRLFIVCGKSITEDDFREEFSKHGKIEEIWMVKDKATDAPKGITYVKFSKTSEAATAMEEMNGKCIGNHPRPLKVLIAHSREQGSRREMNEEERLLRLFVVVPKSLTESELRETFAEFGDIDYVNIVRDKITKESKGFGYVKYHRMSHAARAFEDCDRSFKPVFADPKPPKDQKDYHYSSQGGYSRAHDMVGHRGFSFGDYNSGPDFGTEGGTRLTVIASPQLNQDQLWRLFDIIPGLDYCELRRDRKSGQTRSGLANVVYNNPQSAQYAKDKLHGFEYPPGQRMIIRYDPPSQPRDMASISQPAYNPLATTFGNMGARVNMLTMPQNSGVQPSNAMPSPVSAMIGPVPPPTLQPNSTPLKKTHELAAQLAETIAQASSLIQAAGLCQGDNQPLTFKASPPVVSTTTPIGETYDPAYCSVKLPPPQPLAPVDSLVAERLFIVSYPTPPPIYVLKDVFGRFGNLIDIYMLNGKTFGYAKFALKESADRAIEVLHGQEIMGSRMKVMTADPQEKSEHGHNKRMKME